jgi:opacity protein-like surface antigen
MDDQRTHSCLLRNLRKAVLQFIVLAVLAVPAMPQNLSFGGKVGVPVIDPFVLSSSLSSLNNYSFIAQRYTVGPTFELELPYKLNFQADALYKHLHYVSNPFGFNTFQATTTANSWEFPLVVKRYLLGEATRPYGDLGVSFRHVGGSTTFSNSVFRATQDPLELVHPWSTGFVAGGGVDVGYGSIHISPEIRYTRWATENFNASNGVLSSNLNSLDILISVTFHP